LELDSSGRAPPPPERAGSGVPARGRARPTAASLPQTTHGTTNRRRITAGSGWWP